MSDNKLRLSPPWHTFFSMIKHAIGRDRCVNVLEMEQQSDILFIIPIEVKNREKAHALATVLTSSVSFGNIEVCIHVLHCDAVVRPNHLPQDRCCLIRTFKRALGSNYYFRSIEFKEVFDTTFVYPIFRREVLQFFNDDLSDYYSNFNGAVANVFADILKPQVGQFPINPSTANK